MRPPVAVVTGAGSGIGRAIARELSRRGYTVAVSDIDARAADAVAAELAPEAWGAQLDVTDGEAATALAETVAERHERLDVWVSNAGISHMARFTEITAEALERTLTVNLKGVFLCGQAAARTMQRFGRGGVIVNLASMAGKQGRVPFLAD